MLYRFICLPTKLPSSYAKALETENLSKTYVQGRSCFPGVDLSAKGASEGGCECAKSFLELRPNMRLTATDTSRHTWSTGASSRLSKDHDTWRDSYGIESEDLSSILDSQVQAERPLPWYLAVSRTRHELCPGSIGEIHFLGANNIRKHQARHVPGYLELSITICSLYVAYLDTIHGASILFVLRDSSARVR